MTLSLNRTPGLPGPGPATGVSESTRLGPGQALGPGPLQPSPSLWYYGRPRHAGGMLTTKVSLSGAMGQACVSVCPTREGGHQILFF